MSAQQPFRNIFGSLFFGALLGTLSYAADTTTSDANPGAENAEVGWLADASKAKFPDRPASGRLHRQPFQANYVRAKPYYETGGKVGDPPAKQARVDGVTLTFQQEKDAGDAPAFVVFCVTKPDEIVDGKTFVVGPGGLFKQTEKIPDKNGEGWFYPVAGIHIRRADKKSASDLFPKATMRLTFGKRKDSHLPGQIYLCIDDPQQTFVAGTFDAILDEEKKN